MNAAALDAALRAAGLPIIGAAIGVGGRPVSDKAAWRVDWAGEPSEAQKAAARAVIDAFDPVAEAAKPPPKSELEQLRERVAALESESARASAK